jgi:asparagine synthase (glutamine-hydrolysing)
VSGIAGLVRFDGKAVAPGEIDAMLVPMRRRGPDRQAAHAAGNAGFGQALLATTREALVEQQPWVHQETHWVVVSDSRLDNRPELLAELGFTRDPDDIGDGELLHAAWQRWGEGCADRLRGDFAVAIWDPVANSLFCARDIMGVRPLYFHHAPGRLFAFASDPDALLALPEVPRRLDEGRIADALMGDLEGIDRTSTFFLDIERLPPARTLRVAASGAVQAEYWHPLRDRPAGLPDTEAGWVAAVRDALEHAVRCRLRGTGRVGSMLSGGLDSSSLAALAQQQLPPGSRLPTFSAINSAGSCIETACVHSMLAAFPFEATLVDVPSIATVAPAVHAQFDRMTEPFDAGMSLVSAMYAAASGAGVRSLLDGLPADNLYVLGDLFRVMVRTGQWRRLWAETGAMHRVDGHPRPRLRSIQSIVGAVVPATLRRPWQAARERTFYSKLLLDSGVSPASARGLGLRARFDRYRSDMARSRQGDPAGTPLSVMTSAYITAAIERYNRIASAYGVEPRPAFLDRRVIELHAWLPQEFRLRDGLYKWALRAAMQDLLPRDVAWRSLRDHLGSHFDRALVAPWLARQPATDLPDISPWARESLAGGGPAAGLVKAWLAQHAPRP